MAEIDSTHDAAERTQAAGQAGTSTKREVGSPEAGQAGEGQSTAPADGQRQLKPEGR
jgi:hypothetical protein